MNAHEIAGKLCIKAEALGLCHPTESMISEAIDNALSNQIQEIDYELRDMKFEAAADYLKRLSKVENLDKQEENNTNE